MLSDDRLLLALPGGQDNLEKVLASSSFGLQAGTYKMTAYSFIHPSISQSEPIRPPPLPQLIAPLDRVPIESPPKVLEKDLARLPIFGVERVRSPDSKTTTGILDGEHDLLHDGLPAVASKADLVGPEVGGLAEHLEDTFADGGPGEEVEDGVVVDGLLGRSRVPVLGKRSAEGGGGSGRKITEDALGDSCFRR